MSRLKTKAKAKITNLEPSVLEFTSLHSFFDAYRKHLVTRTKGKVTSQMLAKKLGFKSKTMIVYLATGARKFSDDQLQKLAKICNWSEDETQYAKLLSAYDASTNLAERKFHLSEIEAFRPGTRPEVFAPEVEDEMSLWYMPLITTLVSLKDFKPEVDWIHARTGFQLHQAEIFRALKRLEIMGFIKASKNGKYELKTKHLLNASQFDGKKPSKESLIRYHKQMLGKAEIALEKQSSGERFFTGSVLTIPKHKIPEAIEYLIEFRRKFISLMSDNQPEEEVYYLSLQFFRMTFPIDG